MAITKREVLSVLSKHNAVHQSIVRLSNINLDVQGFWKELNLVLNDVCEIIEAENGLFASIEKDSDDDGDIVLIQSVAKHSLQSLQKGSYLSLGSEFQNIVKQRTPVVVSISDSFFSEEITTQIKNNYPIEYFVFVPVKQYGGMIFFLSNKSPLVIDGILEDGISFLSRTSEIISVFYENCLSFARQKERAELQLEWLENMTHQILAPVTGISGQVENLSRSYKVWEKTNPQRIDNTLINLLELSDWAIRMIRNFAWTARGQNSPVELNKYVEEDVAAKFISYARSVQGLAKTRGINRVNVDVDSFSQINGKIEIDNKLFKQAVVNILDNAVKYSNPKSDILINATASNGLAHINITNYGIPIAKDEVKMIFSKYYRSEAARQRYSVGSGIGLVIAREIIRLHGGDISTTPSVAAPIGWKSTFTISLPIISEENRR